MEYWKKERKPERRKIIKGEKYERTRQKEN
jgi:hypothetical protein